jgi:WD40 repeat protein
VKVIDTESHREWFFKAHDQSIRCIFVLPPGDRVLTCSYDDVRLWTLHRDAPIPIATLPGLPFNIARNDQGDLLFDGNVGKTSWIARGAQSSTVLHSHSDVARGANWCHGRACSAGWDGRVLCTSPATGVTEEVATFGTAVRWLAAGGDRCFAAVSSGGLYELGAPSAPLYRHDREPYRLSVSPDGTRIASIDWGGSLKVWDVKQQRLLATVPHVHDGLAVDAVWLDSERLVTAGTDGSVHLLGPSFDVERTWHLATSVKYASAGAGSIEAVTDNGIVWRFSLATGMARTTSLQTAVNAFAISPHRRTMAVGSTDGELFLIDSELHVSARRPAYGEHAKITSAIFEDETALIVALSNGRVMRIGLGH